ncbi:jg14528 [Pararge aegeria aegeria]|uniref:Jg14528 protein n=1 Tax=Pararge aegeria aegeria TaxID=348720 RepID=A0A8S4S0R4_9NEOP|nr:jg14528 [Pararge aegeria aegeria]
MSLIRRLRVIQRAMASLYMIKSKMRRFVEGSRVTDIAQRVAKQQLAVDVGILRCWNGDPTRGKDDIRRVAGSRWKQTARRC